MTEALTTFGKKALAAGVLILVAALALKFVIGVAVGIISAVFWVVVAVAAVGAVLWAMSILR